jgi:hypothetical protein
MNTKGIPSMRRIYIMMIESHEGEDTFLRCGSESQDYLFCVLSVDDEGHAEIVDNGYRSYDEALKAWPEAGGKKI